MEKKNQNIILGISAYYHDSAACIIVDGDIVAAAQEERFTRKKGDSSFPHNAISYCLEEVGIEIDDLTDIVFYENYLDKFKRILLTHHLNAPFGLKSFLASMPKWLTSNLWLEQNIQKELNTKKKINFVDHHYSHAASAFFPSPFSKAAILTVDGVGEFATTTYGIGNGNDIKILKQIKYPDSLGLLYSTFTYYLGFKINSGEYKVMGLAPYGKPIYADLIKEKLVKINDDGSIKLNQEYFNYSKGLTMSNEKFNDLFGDDPRLPESRITQKDMDIAASIQEVTNEIMAKLASHVYEETKEENLVLAGGVALNVVSNSYLKKHSKFKNIWIQPASGDAGGALGCALYWYYKHHERTISKDDSMKGAFLGPDIKDDNDDADYDLRKIGGVFKNVDDDTLIDIIVGAIQNDKVVGLARGRMEFGPRALGHRSILGNATNLDTQQKLNLKIKKRESFRPFAPIVLKEDAKDYFDIDDESPYMLRTYYIKKGKREKQNNELNGLDLLYQKRSIIPAVTHVDYSARVQTVDEKRNPFLYKLLKKYKAKTKVSVLVNTSFNVRGEPIVDNEINAFKCFMNTDMDICIIGNRVFYKEEQNRKVYDSLKDKKERVTLD